MVSVALRSLKIVASVKRDASLKWQLLIKFQLSCCPMDIFISDIHTVVSKSSRSQGLRDHGQLEVIKNHVTIYGDTRG